MRQTKFNLSDKKRALLNAMLKEKGLESASNQKISRRNSDGPVLASFLQERLWALEQMGMANSTYNMNSIVRLNGLLNVAVLERSLQEIVRRHETLRTTFVAMDGRPMQIISPTFVLEMPVLDLYHLPENEREDEA